ncbi:MAG: terminase large subunit domain-containing protein, partial [Candidatus Thorarchaeota archaeon]
MTSMSSISATLQQTATPALTAQSLSAGKWQLATHLKIIDRVLVDAATKKLQQQGYNGVIIEMQPRGGKSELCSKYFPMWFLGTFPGQNIILCSATDDLAWDFSEQTRDLLREHGEDVFGVSVRQDAKSKTGWKTTAGGSLRAAGVGGSIMGRGADVLIIDDYFKNVEEARSENNRNKLYEWYRSTSSTRLTPDGFVVIVCCIAEGTRVLMGNGSWKEIQDIQPGDKVRSYDKSSDGIAQTVTATIPQGVVDTYELKTANHTIFATARHPFLRLVRPTKNPWYRAKSQDFEWVKLEDLKEGDYICSYQLKENGVNPQKFTREDMWVLGYMFGDGWITRIPNDIDSMRWATCVARGSALDDKSDLVVSYIEHKFNAFMKLTSGGYYRTDVAEVGRTFEKLGLVGKAKTKRIPEYVYTLPLELRDAFLDGLCDADGTVGQSDMRTVWLCNRELVKDIKMLALSCGYKTSNLFENTRTSQPPNSPQPIDAYYCAIHIGSKRYKQPFGISRVRHVAKAGTRRVYDLSVNGSENFIVEGLVCHNTRWHIDDLSGKILHDARHGSGEKWLRVRIPAICDDPDHDPLGRSAGEAMWPERFSEEWLQGRKRGYIAAGYEWMWLALYQQSPPMVLDSEFSPEYFKDEHYFTKWPKDRDLRWKILILDPSLGKTDKSDYSAWLRIGLGHNGLL